MALTKVTTGIIADSAVTTTQIADATVTSTDMAVDPRNASNLNAGDVPLAQLGNAPATDTTGLKDDIALLAFKTQANGSLARYNLIDQSVDAFEDASGVDASASANETRSANNYYSGADPQSPVTTTFTATPGGGTWTIPAGVSAVNAVIVAGGGGGGGAGAGGGGGGGVLVHTTFAVTPAASVTVTVGAGGAGGPSGSATDNWGTVGGNSVFSTLTAFGGGRGGAYEQTGSNPGPGGAGGSGGGGGGAASNTPAGAATQTDQGGTGYGFAGGLGHVGTLYTGGGGGGSFEVGQGGQTGGGGSGGDGTQLATWTSYGDSGRFGGGGGGGAHWYPGTTRGGPGGSGGGGQGAQGNPGGFAGTANTGGGGGGGWLADTNTIGGAGGSGFIGLKYTPENYLNVTLVSNTLTAVDAVTKGDLVITYNNGTGTTSLNTDLVASISRDNGANYTPATLVLQGTTGGHSIATAHDVTLGGTDTSQMLWKIVTANQGSAKETRIQGVSLGWS